MKSPRDKRKRLLSAAAYAALCGLALAAAALAADRTDPLFGSNGVAAIPAPTEARRLRVDPVVMDLAPDGAGGMVAALGDFSGHSTYIGAARLRADGSLDPSFGEKGFAEAVGLRDGVVIGLGNSQGQAVAVQPDGKVVLVGYQAGGFSPRIKAAPVLVRFGTDGTLDKSFGASGKVAPRPSQAKDEALHAIAIESIGRIVAVGAKREHLAGKPAALVIAYRADGSIDSSFGHGGRLLFPARGGDKEYTGFKAVRVLPSGKLLVSGYRQGRLFFVRLISDGRLDRSFGGGDGEVTIDVGDNRGCVGDCGLASPFVIQPGGRILAAANLSLGSFALVRLSPDGRLDRSFGHGGIFRSRRSFFRANDLALDGRGRLLVAGIGEKAVSRRDVRIVFTTLRFEPNGQLDRSFGHGGNEALPAGESSAALAALTQPSGRVVVAGGAQYPGGGHRLLLTRYLDH